MRTALALALIFSASLALAPATARGQFRGGGFGGFGGGFGGGGFGYGGGLGYGFGFMPYYYSPAMPEPLLYRQALNQGARATMGPVTHDAYRNNRASYIYHLHDPGYLAGMTADERRRIEAQVGRYADGPPPRARTASRRAARADPAPAEVRPTPQALPAGAMRQEPRHRVE